MENWILTVGCPPERFADCQREWLKYNILGSIGIEGNYFVRYFVGAQETASFDVKIESTDNNEIYSLSWYKEEQKILHGVGTFLDDSLVFAWGGIDFRYNLHSLHICKENTLKMQTVEWGAREVHCKKLIKAK